MRGRADLEYHVTRDMLVYYTYSQGFRPGGFNRGSSQHLPNAAGQNQYATPITYLSDNLTNNEVGWKTMWFDHRLEVNGAVYQENWSNAQVSFFCPQCGLGNLTYNTNGPDYQVKGVELQIAANVWHGLSVNGSAAWNSGELKNSPALVGNIPGTADFGKPLTTFYVNGVADADSGTSTAPPAARSRSSPALRGGTCACATTGRSGTTCRIVQVGSSTSRTRSRPPATSSRTISRPGRPMTFSAGSGEGQLDGLADRARTSPMRTRACSPPAGQ